MKTIEELKEEVKNSWNYIGCAEKDLFQLIDTAVEITLKNNECGFECLADQPEIVCEWKRSWFDESGDGYNTSCGKDMTTFRAGEFTCCPFCGKPIKAKED